MEQIDLKLRADEKSSEIFIGVDLLQFLVRDLKERPLGNRIGIVTDTQLESILAKKLLSRLIGAGLKAEITTIPPGETSKCWDRALSIFEWMADLGFDRKSVLLAVGGGVVGDLTGFVASLYMRSIPYVQVPTTLLAQVDSSIGGKTAIDLPRRKNLLGTFHQPHRVYVDPLWLTTLSVAEFRNGLAEAIKTAIVKDAILFRFLENHREALLSRDLGALEAMVGECCKIKAALVMEDEKDRGIRQILNFGHTVGHAIEAYEEYRIPHGWAVSIGISVEAEVSVRMDLLPLEEKSRIFHLLESFGLPTRIPCSYDPKSLVDLMHSDKKALNGQLSLVLPSTIGIASLHRGIPSSLIESVLKEVTE